MKLKTLAAALLAVMAAHSAHAADTTALEPGLRFTWSFGAEHREKPSLRLGLYPNDLGWRRLWADAGVEEAAQLERPAVLDLRVGSDAGLHLMGLPLNAQALGLNVDENGSSGGSFMKPVLIVLAAGVATALVISSAGDAAEDNNPTVDPDGDPPGRDTDICFNDSTVGGDECIVGGDGG